MYKYVHSCIYLHIFMGVFVCAHCIYVYRNIQVFPVLHTRVHKYVKYIGIHSYVHLLCVYTSCVDTYIKYVDVC